jgi:hypothetical protein
MNNPDHSSESLEKFFWVKLKILKFFDADPGWKKSNSGSGMEKIRILHPGKLFRIRYTEKKLVSAFSDSSGDGAESFLESPEAAPFLGVFRNIRLPHLVNHHMDVEILVSDRIIPNSWMTSIYYTRWMTLLRYLKYIS